MADARFGTPDAFLGGASAPLTLNRYLYALSNPVMFADPSGHVPDFIGGFAASLRRSVGPFVSRAVSYGAAVVTSVKTGAPVMPAYAYNYVQRVAAGWANSFVNTLADNVRETMRKKYCNTIGSGEGSFSTYVSAGASSYVPPDPGTYNYHEDLDVLGMSPFPGPPPTVRTRWDMPRRAIGGMRHGLSSLPSLGRWAMA